ncbi:MAG: hypothetical protein CMJ90_18325 [Planctomycetes bacterium]|nr:hypothetical protein [Planctomycetota bacterium]
MAGGAPDSENIIQRNVPAPPPTSKLEITDAQHEQIGRNRLEAIQRLAATKRRSAAQRHAQQPAAATAANLETPSPVPPTKHMATGLNDSSARTLAEGDEEKSASTNAATDTGGGPNGRDQERERLLEGLKAAQHARLLLMKRKAAAATPATAMDVDGAGVAAAASTTATADDTYASHRCKSGWPPDPDHKSPETKAAAEVVVETTAGCRVAASSTRIHVGIGSEAPLTDDDMVKMAEQVEDEPMETRPAHPATDDIVAEVVVGAPSPMLPCLPSYVTRLQVDFKRLPANYRNITPQALLESLTNPDNFLADILRDDDFPWEWKKKGIFPDSSNAKAVCAELVDYSGYIPVACFFKHVHKFRLGRPLSIICRKYAAMEGGHEACLCHYFEKGMPVKFHMDLDGECLLHGHKERAAAHNPAVWDIEHEDAINAGKAAFRRMVASITEKAKEALSKVGLPGVVFAVHMCDGYKPSCHVVAIKNAWAPTLKNWKAFVDCVLRPTLEKKEEAVFDEKIYQSAHAFRMNGCCKWGKWRRPLRNEPDPKLSDPAAIEMYNTRCLEFEWRSFPVLIMPDEMHAGLDYVKYFPAEEQRARLGRARVAHARAGRPHVGHRATLPPKVLSEAVKRVRAILPDIKTPPSICSSDTKSNVVRIQFSRTFTCPCPFGGKHSSNSVLLELHTTTGNLALSCFGSACEGQTKVLAQIPLALLRTAPVDLDVLPEPKMIDGINTVTYEAQHCAKLPFGESVSTILLRSGMGTGKTHQLVEFLIRLLQQHGDATRVLIVLPRRELCKSILVRINTILADEGVLQKFQLYLDKRDRTLPTGELTRINLLIIQMDSMVKLPWNNGTRWHMGILDESESSGRHFESKTMDEKRRVVYQNLEAHFHPRVCEFLFLCDAHLDKRSEHIAVECLRRTKVLKMVNTFQTDTNTYISYVKKKKGEWYSRLLHALRAGKNVYMPCNCSTDEMDTMKTKLLQDVDGLFEDDVLVIHSKSPKEVKDTMKTPNEGWKTRVVMLSPTGAMGVDCTMDWFHLVFAHFVSVTTTACGAHQLKGRVRKNRGREVHVFFHNAMDKGDGCPETTKELERSRAVGAKIVTMCTRSLRDNVEELKKSPVAYIRLCVMNQREKQRSKTNFAGEFRKLVEADGGYWRPYKPSDAQKTAGCTVEMKKKLKQERVQRIVDAPLVDENEFKRLCGHRNPDELDQAKIDKYKAARMYPNAEELTFAFLRDWFDSETGKCAMYNFRRAVERADIHVPNEYERLRETTIHRDFAEHAEARAAASFMIDKALVHYGFGNVVDRQEGRLVYLFAPILSEKKVSWIDVQQRLDADTPTRAWFLSGDPDLLATAVRFKNPIVRGAEPSAHTFHRFIVNMLRKALGNKLNLQRVEKIRIKKNSVLPTGWPKDKSFSNSHVINPKQRKVLLDVYLAHRKEYAPFVSPAVKKRIDSMRNVEPAGDEQRQGAPKRKQPEIEEVGQKRRRCGATKPNEAPVEALPAKPAADARRKDMDPAELTQDETLWTLDAARMKYLLYGIDDTLDAPKERRDDVAQRKQQKYDARRAAKEATVSPLACRAGKKAPKTRNGAYVATYIPSTESRRAAANYPC